MKITLTGDIVIEISEFDTTGYPIEQHLQIFKFYLGTALDNLAANSSAWKSVKFTPTSEHIEILRRP